MIPLLYAQVVKYLVQSAAKGSLSVPAGEMIEILVHLAVHNRVFSEQAQLTLAGWDEAASRPEKRADPRAWSHASTPENPVSTRESNREHEPYVSLFR